MRECTLVPSTCQLPRGTLLLVLAVTHTLVSLPIGAHVESAPAAFALAFLVHLFLDTLLHWNVYIERHRWPYVWVALDVVGALALAYWLVPDRFFTAPMLAAIAGGNVPDVILGLIDLLRKFGLRRTPKHREHWFIRFHDGLQNETLSPAKGLAWQVAASAAAIWLVVR